jgi:hypothetical protein
MQGEIEEMWSRSTASLGFCGLGARVATVLRDTNRGTSLFWFRVDPPLFVRHQRPFRESYTSRR